MPAETVTREDTSTRLRKRRRFDKRDWKSIAEYILQEWKDRSRRRGDREKHWKEIDRQVAMIPPEQKSGRSGQQPAPQWLPEFELPLQAQTLEVLTADDRRMMFPRNAPWFVSHAEMTEQGIRDFNQYVNPTGKETDAQTHSTQLDLDSVVTGLQMTWQSRYDFRGNVTRIAGERYKYGDGVGRVVPVTKRIVRTGARGMEATNLVFPALLPRTIKQTYLDDHSVAIMHEGHYLSGGIIFATSKRYEDLVIAAKKGESDPNKDDGGWMPSALGRLKPDEKGFVDVIEYEGDLVIPRSTTDSMVLRGVVVSVAVAKAGSEFVQGDTTGVFRFRWRQDAFNSYIHFPCFYEEDVTGAYSSSPLMKGRPLAAIARDTMSRAMEAAALNTQPPVSYDPDDPHMQATGGPQLYPNATIPSATGINVHNDIGNVAAMWQMYVGVLAQYADVTGINAARLGAQTISHTTAFAKDAELTRASVRTVDHVGEALDGPLQQFLDYSWMLGRRVFRKQACYVQPFGGYVDVESKKALPERVVWETHGSGTPAEEAAKLQQRIAAVQQAIQVEVMRLQVGMEPKLNLDEIQKSILREGGFSDVDAFLSSPGGARAPAIGPGVPGGSGAPAPGGGSPIALVGGA